MNINIRGNLYDLSSPMVMGILNVTPDSFYDGGKHKSVKEILNYVEKMIDDGMFKDFKIDEVYALHNWPETPLGTFGVNNGPMMAAVDEFDITVIR